MSESVKVRPYKVVPLSWFETGLGGFSSRPSAEAEARELTRNSGNPYVVVRAVALTEFEERPVTTVPILNGDG